VRQRRGFFLRRPRPQLFDIEGLESPKDFPRLAAIAVEEAKRELHDVHLKPPGELVAALDSASNRLCRIADAAELCRNVHPNQTFVAQANEAVQEIAAYMGDVNLDRSVYEGMRDAEGGEDFERLPFEAKAVLHHMRVSMEREGVHLPDAEKAACLELLDKEQHLSFEIVQRQEQLRRSMHGGEDSGAWVPKSSVEGALGQAVGHLQKRASKCGDEVFIPADSACAEQVLKAVPCSTSRRAVYEAQQTSDELGAEQMAELLSVRQQLARLRGYSTWNEYAQREALLSAPERVESFITSAWGRMLPGFEAEVRTMASEKERLGLGAGKLEPWDVPLILARCQQEHAREEMQVAEYLSYASLMRGVDMILSRLLGLTFRQEKPGPGELWHDSVQKFTLRDGERALGILYLDPFMRPGKVIQSAQFTLQGSKRLESGEHQVPMTTLVYSLPVGTAGLPLSCAITFMHEIGHAVHSLLSETTYQHLSGTRGTVDFVEFPSHLFEHFVLDPACLATYATHGKSGAPMSPEVQGHSRSSRLRFAYLEAMQQLMYAAVDQAFYSCVPSSSSPASEVRAHLATSLGRFDAESSAGPVTALLGLSKPSKFDHLVHYGGSYYCYLFNRALSAHVWDRAFREDPFAPGPGGRLREFLRSGSVVQSLDTIEALLPPGAGGFRAEDVPLDAFLKQLSGE